MFGVFILHYLFNHFVLLCDQIERLRYPNIRKQPLFFNFLTFTCALSVLLTISCSHLCYWVMQDKHWKARFKNADNVHGFSLIPCIPLSITHHYHWRNGWETKRLRIDFTPLLDMKQFGNVKGTNTTHYLLICNIMLFQVLTNNPPMLLWLL